MPNHAGPMSCPVDGATLVMSERSGIEIDYCPTCRGVWLDRGELDKLVERAATTPAFLSRDDDRERYRRDDDDYRDRDRPYRKSKRRSLLEDLFDID